MLQPARIALIACFIGKLPWYFEYFAHSCSYNPSIDFFIITDDVSYSKPLPGNMKILLRNIDQISELASQKLGLSINIKYGYKLCDFKPAYGVIFSDFLTGYDFWGHTDIDIIFGNIRAFITNDLLAKHDLISVRPDWLTGCFLIYKNIPTINQLFKLSKDFMIVFQSDRHFCFDETNFAHDAFSDGKMYYEIDTEIESMMHVVQKASMEKLINPFFDLFIIEGLPGRLQWQEGKLYYRTFEVLLYHLIHFKKMPRAIKSPVFTEAGFRIGPSNIRHMRPTRSFGHEN